MGFSVGQFLRREGPEPSRKLLVHTRRQCLSAADEQVVPLPPDLIQAICDFGIAFTLMMQGSQAGIGEPNDDGIDVEDG